MTAHMTIVRKVRVPVTGRDHCGTRMSHNQHVLESMQDQPHNSCFTETPHYPYCWLLCCLMLLLLLIVR